MATQQTRTLARVMAAPSVILLFLWMIVPLAMTLYFSTLRYSLLDADAAHFVGLTNYGYFLSDPNFITALVNTLILVGAVLAISVGGGMLVALLMDQQIFGRPIVRLMVIAPFFVMPTVSALVWKNLLMNPVSGLFAWIAKSAGLPAVDWFTNYPMISVIIIVAWQWLPFASLILLTALQSLDGEQKEAALLDGAKSFDFFYHITLPHVARAMTVVVLIETIFLLSVFAEILVTTNGGPGTATTNLPYEIYLTMFRKYEYGEAAAAGVVVVIGTIIVATFALRTISSLFNEEVST